MKKTPENTFSFVYFSIMQVLPLERRDKRPIGHIAHLGNQFKSLNTFEQSYDDIYHKVGLVILEEKTLKLTLTQ